jgi:flagellar motor switch protein FliG
LVLGEYKEKTKLLIKIQKELLEPNCPNYTKKKMFLLRKIITMTQKGLQQMLLCILKKKDMHNTTNFVIYFFGPKLYGNFVFLV